MLECFKNEENDSTVCDTLSKSYFNVHLKPNLWFNECFNVHREIKNFLSTMNFVSLKGKCILALKNSIVFYIF